MSTYQKLPISFNKGVGVWLHAKNGDKYLDALSGIAVNTLGYGHSKFVKAISEQMNAGALMAFNEDKAIHEAVHKGMANKVTPNIDLGLDGVAKLFRLLLQRLLEQEQTL